MSFGEIAWKAAEDALDRTPLWGNDLSADEQARVDAIDAALRDWIVEKLGAAVVAARIARLKLRDDEVAARSLVDYRIDSIHDCARTLLGLPRTAPSPLDVAAGLRPSHIAAGDVSSTAGSERNNS